MINRSRRKLLAAAFALTACASGLSRAADSAGEKQAQEMVAKAIALFSEKGEAAFAVFNEGQASGFADGEIYIVVQSKGPEAKVLAHAAEPKLVGTPLSEIKDPTGLKFGEIMSADATTAGSWFEYDWPNPETGKMGRKKSWAMLHDGLVFISGIYLR